MRNPCLDIAEDAQQLQTADTNLTSRLVQTKSVELGPTRFGFIHSNSDQLRSLMNAFFPFWPTICGQSQVAKRQAKTQMQVDSGWKPNLDASMTRKECSYIYWGKIAEVLWIKRSPSHMPFPQDQAETLGPQQLQLSFMPCWTGRQTKKFFEHY